MQVVGRVGPLGDPCCRPGPAYDSAPEACANLTLEYPHTTVVHGTPLCKPICGRFLGGLGRFFFF